MIKKTTSVILNIVRRYYVASALGVKDLYLKRRDSSLRFTSAQNDSIRLLGIIFFALFFLASATPALADTITVHVAIIDSTKTIFYGNVNVDSTGCSVKDTTNVVHTFTSPLTVCALDKAAQTGNFMYQIENSSFGLFIQGIASDSGAADFSTYWSYDASRTLANVGVADSTAILQNGDWLFFHFDPMDNKTKAIQYGLAYLKSQQDSTGKIAGYDFSTSQFDGASSWATHAFVANGVSDLSTIKLASGTSLLDYLSSHNPTLSDKTTDWAKHILAIVTAGQDPYTFGGIDSVSQLETYTNNNQLGSTTALNDDVFGLLALTAAHVSTDSAVLNDSLNFVLTHQNGDGGFSYSATGTSDVDDSASTLMALVAVDKSGLSSASLSAAIVQTQQYLLGKQNADGGFPSDPSYDPSSNTSSTTWALMALRSLGLSDSHVTTAESFIEKNQYLGDGSFAWQLGSPAATGDTDTSSYALMALAGKSWPMTIYQGAIPAPTPTSTPSGTITPTPTLTPTPTPVPNTPTPTPTPQSTTTTTTTYTTTYVTPTPGPTVTAPVVSASTLLSPTPTTAPLPGVLGAQTMTLPQKVITTQTQGFSFPSMFLGAGFAYLSMFALELMKKFSLFK